MKLKTYHAKTMHDVMAQIRQDLGDDAVIVTTLTLDDGSIRVTAALDEILNEPVFPDADETAEAPDFDTHVLFGGVRDYDYPLADEATLAQQAATVDHVTRALLKHGVPAALHDKIITAMENSFEQGQTDGTAQRSLAEALNVLFRFDPLPDTVYERPIMLVGQPGAGKTTTIAKLATRAIMAGLKPAVITADGARAGAVEQLAAFTRVLGLELIKVNTPDQLKQALNDNAKADQVLIDCPGINAFDPADMKELYAYSRVAPMDLVVTLPGGLDADEAADIARAFAVVGAKWLLPTRLDMARRLGGVLAAAEQGQLRFAGAGTSSKVADGLAMLDAVQLAQILIPSPVNAAAAAESKGV